METKELRSPGNWFPLPPRGPRPTKKKKKKKKKTEARIFY
jgi:hypothetical protein